MELISYFTVGVDTDPGSAFCGQAYVQSAKKPDARKHFGKDQQALDMAILYAEKLNSVSKSYVEQKLLQEVEI